MTTTPEGRVKSSIKKGLKARGCYFFMPIGGPFTVHGVPDFIICYLGIFVGVEAKALGNKADTTVNQKDHLARIIGSGGISLVADCWEDVRDVLDAIDERRRLRRMAA